MTITPTVNINGTSREELVAQRIAIADACIDLIEALKAAAPHDRDYPDFEQSTLAQVDHFNRIAQVRALYGAVHAEALAIHRGE